MTEIIVCYPWSHHNPNKFLQQNFALGNVLQCVPQVPANLPLLRHKARTKQKKIQGVYSLFFLFFLFLLLFFGFVIPRWALPRELFLLCLLPVLAFFIKIWTLSSFSQIFTNSASSCAEYSLPWTCWKAWKKCKN